MTKRLSLILALALPLVIMGAGCTSSTEESPIATSTTQTPAPAQVSTTTLNIMVPKDLDRYNQKIAVFVQQGGIPDPSKNWPFVKESVDVPFTTDTLKASAEAVAKKVYTGNNLIPDSVVYLKVQNKTVYILLDMDVDGWAGVSVALAQVHPAVEKTLLQFPEIQKVVFDVAPGDSKSAIKTY